MTDKMADVRSRISALMFNHEVDPETSTEILDAFDDALRSTPAAPHQHRFDVVIRDDEHMRLLGCSNTPCEESYQWDR